MWVKFAASVSPQKPPTASDKTRQRQKGSKGTIMFSPPVIWALWDDTGSPHIPEKLVQVVGERQSSLQG